MAFVMSVMLAACVVAFASVKAKRPSSKSLKGTHPALLMAKYEYPSAQEHLTKRERGKSHRKVTLALTPLRR